MRHWSPRRRAWRPPQPRERARRHTRAATPPASALRAAVCRRLPHLRPHLASRASFVCVPWFPPSLCSLACAWKRGRRPLAGRQVAAGRQRQEQGLLCASAHTRTHAKADARAHRRRPGPWTQPAEGRGAALRQPLPPGPPGPPTRPGAAPPGCGGQGPARSFHASAHPRALTSALQPCTPRCARLDRSAAWQGMCGPHCAVCAGARLLPPMPDTAAEQHSSSRPCSTRSPQSADCSRQRQLRLMQRARGAGSLPH